ncbi:MAG: hypothetical protein NDI82_11535 [Anaeromyxobacteraceae bacterium]|nr:hypothetical protein [Anaeromyxobacteraceae bacterium]
MHHHVRIVIVLSCLTAIAPPALAEGQGAPATGAPPSASKQERCEHGVQKSLCTRCNPKLAAVYKAKGDWCGEHERPESQCVLCHPELAKKGVK